MDVKANVAAMRHFVHATLLAVLFASPAAAQQDEAWRTREQAHYTACMEQVTRRPNDAFDDATAWEGMGGGHPARHCALAALVELGHYHEAAQGLEKLADLVHADATFKAKMLVQSALAWIAANDPGRARAVADAALQLVPDAPHVLLARARALALQGAYKEAVDDLSRVLNVEPKNTEALVLRGAAHRQLDANDKALIDLNGALTLDPTHPEGLLERGIVHRLSGNKSAARVDWRALIEAHPDSEAAREAADNLHALDSGVEE